MVHVCTVRSWGALYRSGDAARCTLTAIVVTPRAIANRRAAMGRKKKISASPHLLCVECGSPVLDDEPCQVCLARRDFVIPRPSQLRPGLAEYPADVSDGRSARKAPTLKPSRRADRNGPVRAPYRTVSTAGHPEESRTVANLAQGGIDVLLQSDASREMRRAALAKDWRPVALVGMVVGGFSGGLVAYVATIFLR